ncbi:hypothetical protein DFJ77DRAFT_436507 [Powellomyces hirtus]|nr:hypothetical protein DFJ77DRAFT_436507 [Powellomyces hirtus]
MGVETVLRWMELNDVEPDADTYTSMMQNHVWNGDGSRAIQVYQDALQFGVLVGDRMKCLLVTAYLLQGNVDAAKAVYQGAHEEGGLTVELCGVMIDGLCKMGRLKEAVGVYDSMPDCNMIPSIHIYTMLMDAHAKSGDVDGVYQYWNKLKASGLQPDLHTYGVLVWTAFRMQYSYDTAVKLVSEMRREGLTPNAVIVALFVDGLCRAGATEEALKILSSDKEAALPAYTSYMHSLAQSGRQGVKEAYQLFREMTTVKGMEVDVVTFTILIDAQARHKDTLHLAHDLFSDMRKMGLMADATVFNVLLAAHVRFCSVASTLNIFEDMINSGIRPTVETFTILIWMYAREAPRSMRVKEDLAELLHDACDDSQPNADILSFITLARAYARKPSDVTLRRLINEVRHQGVEPDSLMFYHLLIASHGNVSALINVVNEMLSHGVALDSRCRGALKLGGLTVVADDSTIILQETSGERWMCGPNIPT